MVFPHHGKNFQILSKKLGDRHLGFPLVGGLNRTTWAEGICKPYRPRILEAAGNAIRGHKKKMSRLWDSRQVRSLSLPCLKNRYLLSRGHCSDVDRNAEITLLVSRRTRDVPFTADGCVRVHGVG